MIAESASTVPEYALIISEKGGPERRTAYRSNELTVGRVQGNDLVLPKGNVSKRHARILYREGRFIVTDLNSTNGTYVNRQRIAQATIVREEDSIFIGDFVIRVEVRAEAHSSEPATPRREAFDAPVPTLAPESESTGHHAVPHHSSHPSWERLSAPEVPSVQSPARATEPPPPGEVSNAGQRLSDLSAFHRKAVALLLERVRAKWGPVPLQPSETERQTIRATTVQTVDQLLTEGLLSAGTAIEPLIQQALDELLDVGPLGDLLRDSAVTAIAISRFDDLLETRDGRQQTAPPGFSSAASLETALRRLCARVGEPVEDETRIDRILENGYRLSALMGAVAPDGPIGVIEKPRRIKNTLDDLVRRGAVSRQMATFLGQCVQARLNLLVVGPRDEGIQLVLGALAAAARERVVSVSDFDDFATEADSIVRLDLRHAQGDSKSLLEVVAALPQARLLVTLSRPDVTAALVEALGGGLSGIVASLRGSSLTRTLLRLPADVVAAQPRVGLDVATTWVRGSFDVVVEVARLRDGRVRVLRVAEIGLDGRGALEAIDIFRFSVARVAAGGAVEGSFVPTGDIPKVAALIQAAGIRLETSTFSRPPSR